MQTEAQMLQKYVDFCKQAGVKTKSYINEDMTVCITQYPFKKTYIYEIETINGFTKITDDTNEVLLYI